MRVEEIRMLKIALERIDKGRRPVVKAQTMQGGIHVEGVKTKKLAVIIDWSTKKKEPRVNRPLSLSLKRQTTTDANFCMVECQSWFH